MANAGNYNDTYSGIAQGASLSAATMTAALNTKEKVANKQVNSADAVGTLTSSSSDSYYPSSKLVGKNLDAKQDKIGAGTANDILTKTTAAGTLGTLTKTATLETDTTKASDDKIPTEKAVCDILNGTSNDIVHKAGAETITGVKVFGKADTAAEPILGKTKTTDADNDGTKFATEAQVYKKQDKLTDEQLNLLNSLSMLSFFPKGTILAFHKNAWDAKNETFKSIWKVCDGDGNLTPNLIGRFLRGASYPAGGTGGGQKTLSVDELPEHNHQHTLGVDNATHNHSLYSGTWDNSSYSDGLGRANFVAGSDMSGYGTADYYNYDNNKTRPFVENNTHKHDLSGSISNAGKGQAFEVLPAYYDVIYIMKVV
ncbi:MAG: hypothetical protein LBK68_06910 [Candidatus Margulisbacteria bacterium]|jgi:hypothetical protein|nr:hypothetical protein [Candidatus Margulisiibacteriota bacterium]